MNQCKLMSNKITVIPLSESRLTYINAVVEFNFCDRVERVYRNLCRGDEIKVREIHIKEIGQEMPMTLLSDFDIIVKQITEGFIISALI